MDGGITSPPGWEIFSGNNSYAEKANGWVRSRLGFSHGGIYSTHSARVGREVRVTMMEEGVKKGEGEGAEAGDGRTGERVECSRGDIEWVSWKEPVWQPQKGCWRWRPWTQGSYWQQQGETMAVSRVRRKRTTQALRRSGPGWPLRETVCHVVIRDKASEQLKSAPKCGLMDHSSRERKPVGRRKREV